MNWIYAGTVAVMHQIIRKESLRFNFLTVSLQFGTMKVMYEEVFFGTSSTVPGIMRKATADFWV